MSESGIRIAALYGIYPCQLGLCGPQEESAKSILLDYLLGKKVLGKKARNILKRFRGAFPYYRLIAKSNNIKDPFEEKVVKAYWIGNRFLEKVTLDSLREMVAKEFLMPDLAKKIPSNSKPHHSFHIFIVGSVTGVITFTSEMLDICRISWGEVIRKPKISIGKKFAKSGRNSAKGGQKSKVIIRFQPIKKLKERYYLGKFAEKTIFWRRDLTPEPKIGDMVSCHWNYLVQVLNKSDLSNLKKYTKITLNSINKGESLNSF